MALRKPRPHLHPPDPVAEALTVDDWFAMPEDGNRYELFEGVLIRMSPPMRHHQDVVGLLSVALHAAATSSGGYAAVGPLGVVLARRIGFLPDIVYVSAEHRDRLSDRGIEAAPDVVVEVGSPSTGTFDRGTKLRTYLEHGVAEVWLVDPSERVVEVVTAATRQRVAFGEAIPSAIVRVGDAGLGA